jgi:glycosyltransferase involved in cell wall biosynthesis
LGVALIEKGRQAVHSGSKDLISVVIPFFNASAYLEKCLQALCASDDRGYELILVDDGSTDSSPEIARRFSGLVLKSAATRGPACARNRGAQEARGGILFFLDADVFCLPGTLATIREAFASDPALAAVIGSYDDAPPESDFLSRYKNLTHHYVHQNASEEASTFWTGCGAIRRDIFLELRGFDESYGIPSIEDIELGYRMRARGYRIALCKRLLVKHAKRWTFASLLRSDVCDRAIPWTVLQLAYGKILDDLNVSRSQRASSAFTCLAVLLGVLGFWSRWSLIGIPLALLPVIAWNRRLYRFYYMRGGAWFCMRAALMHWLYYIYSAVAFGIGCLKYIAQRPSAKGGVRRRADPDADDP